MVYSVKSDDIGTISQFTRIKYIKITTTGTSTPANYQVKLTIAYEPEMQADFSDIRFNTLGNIYIDYWIESKTDSVTATVWVELPDAITDPGSNTIWMFYGNPGLSDGGDGDDTFEFFDDFNDNSIDTNKWNTIGSSYSEAGGVFTAGTVGAVTNGLVSKTYQINDGIIEYRAKTANTEFSSFARSSINTGDPAGNAGTQGVLSFNGGANYEHTIRVAFVQKANTVNIITTNVWYYLRYTVEGVNLKYERFADGSFDTLQATASYTDIGGRTSGYVGITAHGDRQGVFDWVRVRKLITNEPTPTYGTSQHQRRVPQFIN